MTDIVILCVILGKLSQSGENVEQKNKICYHSKYQRIIKTYLSE